jgi:uncharacterized membrane protein YkoI
MLVPRSLSAALLLGLLAMPAFAADSPQRACLSKAEQRAAVADHKAITLAQAIKSLREHGHWAEPVRARLCHRDDRLVYVLTLLARSGKVTSATVDSANGDIINGR